MGVILGSVSLWDARPACTPEGEARGRILPIAGGVKDGVALQRFRFKVSISGCWRAGVDRSPKARDVLLQARVYLRQ